MSGSIPAEIRTVTAGTPVGKAYAALVLVHGRGGSADDMLSLAAELEQPGWACIAPQAPHHTWYPYSFLAPIDQNEPHLSRALATLDEIVAQLSKSRVGPERTALLGFSQGACLTLEYVARHALRYGAVLGLSGGLIGPPGTPRDYAGSLAGTPVLLGCSDVDPHVPLERVKETTAVLTALGATVDERVYPGFGHTVNRDEIEAIRALLAAITA